MTADRKPRREPTPNERGTFGEAFRMAMGGELCKCGHDRREHAEGACRHRCFPPWRRRGEPDR